MPSAIQIAFAVLACGSAIAVVCMIVLMLQLWLEVGGVPNLPPRVRYNRLNILACRHLWTPGIERINRRLNIAGLCFIACMLLGVLLSMFVI